MNARTTVTMAGTLLLLAVFVPSSRAHRSRPGDPLSMGQDQTAPSPPIAEHSEMSSFLFTPEQAGGMIERSQRLSASLDKLAGQYQGPMKEQILVLKRMSESIGAMAEKMKAELEECNGLLRDGAVAKDPAMQDELHLVANSMNEMTGPMEDALRSLERAIQHFGNKESVK